MNSDIDGLNLLLEEHNFIVSCRNFVLLKKEGYFESFNLSEKVSYNQCNFSGDVQ